jgi:dipeptidyl aminopeptidase/acylaminoacyl peptidase
MDPLSVRLLASRRHGWAPDLELAARLFLPASTADETLCARAPGLVVGHGAGSRAANHEDFCLEACRHGFAVLALDFRGHGGSEGVADGPLELDILAAADLLQEHPAVDPAMVCYRGSSMGGFYGLRAAPLVGFVAMVLLCPAGEDVILDALNDGDTEIDRDSEAPVHGAGDRRPLAATARWDRPRLRTYFEQQDSRELAARVDCPVLLVHARHDSQVPFEHSLLLARHLRTDTTLLALKDGGHTSAQHDPAIHRYTTSWLCDRMADARGPRG